MNIVFTLSNSFSIQNDYLVSMYRLIDIQQWVKNKENWLTSVCVFFLHPIWYAIVQEKHCHFQFSLFFLCILFSNKNWVGIKNKYNGKKNLNDSWKNKRERNHVTTKIKLTFSIYLLFSCFRIEMTIRYVIFSVTLNWIEKLLIYCLTYYLFSNDNILLYPITNMYWIMNLE